MPTWELKPEDILGLMTMRQLLEEVHRRAEVGCKEGGLAVRTFSNSMKEWNWHWLNSLPQEVLEHRRIGGQR